MTNEPASSRPAPQPEGRTFILCSGFSGAVIAGYWLGFMAALASGTVPADPPLFPGEYIVASLVPVFLLIGFYVLVGRADGQRRAAAFAFLAVAASAVLDVFCALYLLAPLETLCTLPSPDVGPSARSGITLVAPQHELPPQCRPSPPVTSSPVFWVALAPAALVAVLLCSAAVRRSALLQLVGLTVACLFALAGLLLSLARAFT